MCTFTPKPVKGDWNGTGAHTNFSTESMRKPGGMTAITAAIEKLSKTHAEHISQYGTGNEEQLTGKHETCDMNTFRWGVAGRRRRVVHPLLAARPAGQLRLPGGPAAGGQRRPVHRGAPAHQIDDEVREDEVRKGTGGAS